MDQQETIFDQTFDAEIPVRRRHVVPMLVNIYAWVEMLLGGVLTLRACWTLLMYSSPIGSDDSIVLSYNIGFLIGNILPGILLFLMGFLIWMEVKRAILFNAIVAGFFFLLLVASFAAGMSASLVTGFACVFLLPYWITLLSKRHEWAKAVRGKQS